MNPILVTGAAGKVGGLVVEFFRDRDIPVRALVHHDDERSQRLRALGAEIVVADLTKPEQVFHAINGCTRVYFGLDVSPSYLEATLVMGAVVRTIENFELLVNMSQMTVSQMTLLNMSESPQQRYHWLSDEALNWSGVAVSHLRPTVFQENPFFLDWAAKSIAQSGKIFLPFGKGRTSPVAVRDVAEVAGTMLLDPKSYVGRVIELTGPRSASLYEFAGEYAATLGKEVKYVDVPLEQWIESDLRSRRLPEHLIGHLATMAKLHAANRYDRMTNGVESALHRQATSLSETVKRNQHLFNTI
jgi:NAD(P)H dehydrogenase (quinone)